MPEGDQPKPGNVYQYVVHVKGEGSYVFRGGMLFGPSGGEHQILELGGPGEWNGPRVRIVEVTRQPGFGNDGEAKAEKAPAA
jgi:hypothetical protein